MAWTSWPSQPILVTEASLRDLRDLVERDARPLPDEVQRALVRFLLIRSCGYVEVAVLESFRAYMTSKAHGNVARFGGSWIDRGFNPKPDRLVEMTKRFSQTWAADLEQHLSADDDYLKREMGFLVDRRNKLAHGVGESVGARKALDLYDVAIATADWFIVRFSPYN